jgi:hypothetical protein
LPKAVRPHPLRAAFHVVGTKRQISTTRAVAEPRVASGCQYRRAGAAVAATRLSGPADQQPQVALLAAATEKGTNANVRAKRRQNAVFPTGIFGQAPFGRVWLAQKAHVRTNGTLCEGQTARTKRTGGYKPLCLCACRAPCSSKVGPLPRPHPVTIYAPTELPPTTEKIWRIRHLADIFPPDKVQDTLFVKPLTCGVAI